MNEERKVYRREIDSGMRLLLGAGLIVFPAFLVIGAFLVFNTPGSDFSTQLSNFLPIAAFVAGLGFLDFTVWSWFRFSRIEVEGTKFTCFRLDGRISAAFDSNEVVGISSNLSLNGRGGWVVTLPTGKVMISDSLLGIKAEIAKLEHRFNFEAGPLDGVYRWPDPYYKKYGSLLSAIGVIALLGFFVFFPETDFRSDVKIYFVFIFCLFVVLACLIRGTGAMFFERLVVRSGTYAYYSWTGRKIIEFSNQDVVGLDPVVYAGGEPHSWILIFAKRKLKIGAVLGVHNVIDDIARSIVDRQPTTHLIPELQQSASN